MSVTQVHEALGSFEFELLGNVPRDVLDSIDYFSHIAIIPGRMDPRQYGDGNLAAARYVGVVRTIKNADDGRTNLIQDDIRIGGVGTEFWLGDEEGKGYVIENETLFTSAGFSSVMNTLRPASVGAGTIFSVSGSYYGRHQYETPRSAIKYVCDTMSTELVPVGYKVSNDVKLYAGPESSLFVTTPQCVILRKGGTQGEDMFMRALPSTVDLDEDMEDFSTRLVLLAEADGDTFATGTADIASVAPGVNIYKDIFGNDLVLTRLVSESETTEINADTRAELALRGVIDPHRTLTLAADDYDIHGSFDVGDYVYVYDPDAALIDSANEITIRGLRINPLKLRVTETNWPITEGYTVALRSSTGTWVDLTDYIHWEEQQPATVVVGDYNRDLTDSGETVAGRTGSLIPADTSVPDQVDWVTASFQTVNYNDSEGNPKARQKLVWDTPLNVDSSAITDGDHYEIQYKLDTGSLYSQTWAAASTLTWDQLNTWDQPVEPDDDNWQTINIPWGENTTVIHDLPVGTGFDSRIRAVDRGGNQGAWSAVSTWITSEDNIPPSAPAPPVVAGSAIAIQVVHELGLASGGTFNLENDLAFLEVHYSMDEGFFPDDNSLAGRLRADKGMMAAQTAVVGTFTVPETEAVYVKVVAVDMGGNRSNASAAAQVTADLINSSHISELTASKISAGTISAAIVLSGSIKTAESGQRVELNQDGLQTYTPDGDLSTNLSANPSVTGEFITFRDLNSVPVASISDTGDASVVNVYAKEDVFLAGESVQDKIDVLPRGILALTLAPSNSGDTTAADTAGSVVWNRIVVRDFDATRQYEVCYHARIDLQAVTTATYVGVNCYYAWDRMPTVGDNDGTLFNDQWGGRAANNQDTTLSGVHSFNDTVPDGTDMHLGFYVAASVAGVRYQGTSYGRVWLKDIGLALNYDTFDPAAGGGGSDGGQTPIQTFTRSYSSTWTRSYQGDGDLRLTNDDIYQGQYSGTNGNQRSLIGFNDDQIRADLSGATIKKVELTLDNTHFYNNSGGTAVIGTHDYGSAAGSWSDSRVNQSRSTFSWAKGAKKTVTLSNSYGTDFKSGNATGIALGPGDSTSLTYYGYFAGQNSSNKPVLKITYEK
jgi:hypothetical protein